MKAILIAVLLFAPVAAVTPGLMRREHETLEDGVLIEQNAQDAQATKCDSTSDANCCFTQRGVDMAAAVGRKGFAVGQCAAGAKGIAGDKWKDLLDQGLEVCRGNECKDNNSDVPVEGTCSAFSCPKGFVRRADFRPAAPCTDATICKLNCCDIDFSEIGDRQGGLLTIAIMTSLQNVSRFASLLNPMSPRGDGKNNTPVKKIADRVILLENAAGLYRMMGKVLTPAAKKELCSDGDYTSVRRCIHYAVCVLEHAIDTRATKVDVETYTLLMEYYTRFETLQWEQLIQQLGDDDGEYSKKELECVGLKRFLKSFGGEKSASFIEKVKTESAVYHVSSALLDASKTTHALLDAHRANSSLNATFEALRQAWELPCKLLNCDPTNYWDLLGASHSHSLALLESGASAQHMQAHIKARQRLDFRMVQFLTQQGLAQHGKQGAEVIDNIYRLEGSVAESRIHRYGAVVTDSLKSVIMKYPKNYGVLDDTLLTLVDQKHAGKFFKTPYQKGLLKALSEKRLFFVGSEQEMAQLRERAAFADDEELDPEDEHLESLIRFQDFGKYWTSAWQDVGKMFVKEVKKVFGKWAQDLADWVVTLVSGALAGLKAFVDFIASLFPCWSVGVVRNLGYGQKFPPNGTIGVKLSFAATLAVSLTDLFNDAVINGRVGFSIALTIGFLADMGDCSSPSPGAVKWYDSMMGFGVHIGLSVSAGIWCGSAGGQTWSCTLSLAMGLTAVYVKPAPHHHPKCVLFELTVARYSAWGHCAVSTGIVFRMVCCTINLVGGAEDCGDGGGGEIKIEDVPDGCVEAYVGRGTNYLGCQDTTITGRLCQSWGSQSPHTHNIVNKNLDDATVPESEQKWDHNLCRNPNNQYKIWCYTTDPKKRWEFCNPLAGGVKNLMYVPWTMTGESYNRFRSESYNLAATAKILARKMSECEGDCDYDAQCGLQMKCYQRDETRGAGRERVPGCIAGGQKDMFGADYCIMSNSLDLPASKPGDGFRRRMKNCAGDCDNNGDCASKKCFQRKKAYGTGYGGSAFDRIPGCNQGGDEDVLDVDYCYPGGWMNLISRRAPVFGIQECQGSCQSDAECAGVLKCKIREGWKLVQGCKAGGSGDNRHKNYCYSSFALDVAGGTKGFRRRIKACYGDCDNNNDCTSGRCHQRNHVKENIPGCDSWGSGDLPTWDYCTKEFLIWTSTTRGTISSWRRRLKKCVGPCRSSNECDGVCFITNWGYSDGSNPNGNVPGCGYPDAKDHKNLWYLSTLERNYCVGGPTVTPLLLPWAGKAHRRRR